MKQVRSTFENLAEQIHWILSVDPGHRIKVQGGPQTTALIRAINKLADRCQEAMAEPLGLPSARSAGLHEERNILAAFISELSQGVLICTTEGQILLLNRKARDFLMGDVVQAVDQSTEKLQPGGSVTTLIDKNLIEHALEEINERLNRKALNAVSHFVIRAKEQHILRAQVVPILNRAGRFSGFIILLNDITQDHESDRRVQALLESLTKSARSPLASIRAAIEAMLEYPGMEKARVSQFNEIIHKESIALSQIINAVANDYSALIHSQRSLGPVSGEDLLETIQKRARDRLGIVVHIEPPDKKIWVKVDSYSILLAILYLLIQIKNHTKLWEYRCRLQRDKKFAILDLLWTGEAIAPEIVRQWEEHYLIIGKENSPLVLKEVLVQHEAAIWPYAGAGAHDHARIRFLLPLQEPVESEPIRPVTLLSDSQADFSNLNLNGPIAADSGLDSRLLTELSYTVLIRELAELSNKDEVIKKSRELPGLIHRMLRSGANVSNITRLITTFSDTVMRKLIVLALAQLGPAPVPFAFIALGSEGRKEQTLKTDQDNAIIFQDPVGGAAVGESDVQPYFLKLGDTVCTWLDQAGYAYCRGAVMANNPRWCQPLSTWKTYFARWIHAAQAEDLLHSSIFFDFRHAYGDVGLVESLSNYLFGALADWSGFFRHMTENAVHHKPPLNFFGNFVLESKGPHRNCLDIKQAITPVVEFARIFALKHMIRETNTQERLYRLWLKKILTKAEYNDVEQAYAFMMQLRFVRQISALADEKAKADNYINPKALSSIERKMLKAILKKIEKLQAKMSFEFIGLQDSMQE